MTRTRLRATPAFWTYLVYAACYTLLVLVVLGSLP